MNDWILVICTGCSNIPRILREVELGVGASLRKTPGLEYLEGLGVSQDQQGQRRSYQQSVVRRCDCGAWTRMRVEGSEVHASKTGITVNACRVDMFCVSGAKEKAFERWEATSSVDCLQLDSE